MKPVAAQPGRRIALFATALPPLAGGFWALAKDVHLFLEFASRPSLATARAERRRLASWPGVPGRLEELAVLEQRSGRGPGRLFTLRGRYAYQVGGRTYEGSRLALDWNAFGAHNSEGLIDRARNLAPDFDRRTFDEDRSCGRIPAYESCTHRLRAGQSVRVHYDPADPRLSILENRDLAPLQIGMYLFSPILWRSALAFFALALTGLGVVAAWSSLRSGRKSAAFLRLGGWTIRGFRAAFGLCAVGVALEYYNTNLSWRGALNDSETMPAWGVGLVIVLPIAILGLALIFARPPRALRQN